MEYLLLVLFLVVAWLLLIKLGPRRMTIYEYQVGLKYIDGKYVGSLSPGAHWYFPYFTTVQTLDLRPCLITLSGQEVLSADNVGLKTSLAVKYKVSDPHIAVNTVENYQTALYMELQIALRSIVGSLPIDQLMEERDQVGTRVFTLCEPKA